MCVGATGYPIDKGEVGNERADPAATVDPNDLFIGELPALLKDC